MVTNNVLLLTNTKASNKVTEVLNHNQRQTTTHSHCCKNMCILRNNGHFITTKM